MTRSLSRGEIQHSAQEPLGRSEPSKLDGGKKQMTVTRRQLKWLPNTPKWHQELLLAAAHGDLDTLRRIWSAKKSEDQDCLLWDVVCNTGATCWHWACGGGHMCIAKWLKETEDVDVNLRIATSYCARDRTGLHYAARNGHLHIVQWLIEECQADSNPLTTRDGVSPFQIAVWQNWFEVVRYFVDEIGVDVAQVNNYGCGAVHWMGIVPAARAGGEIVNGEEETGKDLLPMADFLHARGLKFEQVQNVQHTTLHKASWGGHLTLIRYLNEQFQLHDTERDIGGNYAADIADMQASPRHLACARYLRAHCSPQRMQSLRRLGLDPYQSYDPDFIRKAFLERARLCHPDKVAVAGTTVETDYQCRDSKKSGRETSEKNENNNFDSLRKAYHFLTAEGGVGNQRNPSHSINLMLTMVGDKQTDENTKEDGKDGTETITENPTDLFKARLLAVLMEFGDKGIHLSNLISKWNQVWPGIPFPSQDPTVASSETANANTKKKNRLSLFLRREARDVVRVLKTKGGSTVVFPRHLQKEQIIETESSVRKQMVDEHNAR